MSPQAQTIVDNFRGYASEQVYLAEKDQPSECLDRKSWTFGAQGFAQYELFKLMTNGTRYEEQQKEINKIASDARAKMRVSCRSVQGAKQIV